MNTFEKWCWYKLGIKDSLWGARYVLRERMFCLYAEILKSIGVKYSVRKPGGRVSQFIGYVEERIK